LSQKSRCAPLTTFLKELRWRPAADRLASLVGAPARRSGRDFSAHRNAIYTPINDNRIVKGIADGDHPHVPTHAYARLPLRFFRL
jgi:hypothetical protein